MASARDTTPATKADVEDSENRIIQAIGKTLDERFDKFALLFKRVLDESEHRTRSLIENLSSKIDGVIEGVANVDEKLDRAPIEQDKKQSQRMDDLEDVVRSHSIDLRAIKRRLRMTRGRP